ncbi:hypothetical protein CI102_12003 [Trichoderma harzianum]|nr:hypothetical protein CI102_12003 [Trichoderma harzianum]
MRWRQNHRRTWSASQPCCKPMAARAGPIPMPMSMPPMLQAGSRRDVLDGLEMFSRSLGERGGYRRLEFRVAAIGVVASLCFWRCCRKGTLAARPLRALGGDLGETRALMEALYLPMC